jgi:hypothetical protein
MEPYLVPFWHQTCEEYGWSKIVEDGAPGKLLMFVYFVIILIILKGREKYSNKYRELNELDTIEWPAQSPCLNLIEPV